MKWLLLFLGLAPLHADLLMVEQVEAVGQTQAPAQVQLEARGDKIRIDLSDAISVLLDTKTGTSTTLLHDQKVYQTFDPSMIERLGKTLPPVQEALPRLMPTGQKEKIADRDTDIYTFASGNLKITYWLLMGDPAAADYARLSAQLARSPLFALAGELTLWPPGLVLPGLPLKMQIETAQGRVITVSLLRFEKVRLPAIDFSVPRDYHPVPAAWRPTTK